MLGTRRPALAALLTLGLLAVPASGSMAAPQTQRSQPAAQRAAAARVTSVVVVSIDGLNPSAIRRLGAGRTPTVHKLIRTGASTLNARTEHEMTQTLPNHTGMVTSRRIDAARGGHGVTWNDDRRRPATVQEAAGHEVSSVFGVVHRAGKRTALFASKTKFSLFGRSWGDAIDRNTIVEKNAALVRKVRRDILTRDRAFRFVHLSAPDVTGHAHGFMSASYLRAVGATDRRLGKILASIKRGPAAGHTVLVVTADHGGKGSGHYDARKVANYRIPFIVWGKSVSRGTSLYALNPDYARPGKRRTSYADQRQPVRNGDVANLVTDLLGLPRLAGSELDAAQDLDVR